MGRQIDLEFSDDPVTTCAQVEKVTDPHYVDFFRTLKQLRRKLPIETRRTSGCRGMLVGVHKPADPRNVTLCA